MFFGIFVLNRVSIFVLIRVSILSILVLIRVSILSIFVTAVNSFVIANGLNKKEFRYY